MIVAIGATQYSVLCLITNRLIVHLDIAIIPGTHIMTCTNGRRFVGIYRMQFVQGSFTFPSHFKQEAVYSMPVLSEPRSVLESAGATRMWAWNKVHIEGFALGATVTCSVRGRCSLDVRHCVSSMALGKMLWF
jgi:hypothetical protein